MTITHGTRSTYNKGCRCEACREASRQARARQRAAAAKPPVKTERSPSMAEPWVFVGILVAAGAGSLWHAKGLRNAAESSDVLVWPWVLTGFALLAVAAGVAVWTVRTG
jgi:hypothetical protein